MEVYLIAEPDINEDELQRFLTDIGAGDWQSTADTDAQRIIEVSGRLCYFSFKPGLNPNVTRVRNNSDDYIKNLLKQNHGSVFEHVFFNFIFKDVSRVLSAELCRHRVGISISERSLRYCQISPDDYDWSNIPVTIRTKLDEYISMGFDLYNDILGDNYEEQSFNEKKRLTSLARRVMPMSTLTTLSWGCNSRQLRHIIQLRTSSHAESEIRELFTKVRDLMVSKYPVLFSDL